MLWGLSVKPGIQTSGKVTEQEIQLSMVALARNTFAKKPGAYTQVRMHTDQGEDFVICTLVNGEIFQQNLDIKLRHGEKFSFSVEGSSIVNITGYSLPKEEKSLTFHHNPKRRKRFKIKELKDNSVVPSWPRRIPIMSQALKYDEQQCPKCGWESCNCYPMSVPEEGEHKVNQGSPAAPISGEADKQLVKEETDAPSLQKVKLEPIEKSLVQLKCDVIDIDKPPTPEDADSLQYHVSFPGRSKDSDPVEDPLEGHEAETANEVEETLLRKRPEVKSGDADDIGSVDEDEDESLLRKSENRIQMEKLKLKLEAEKMDEEDLAKFEMSTREVTNKGPYKCSYCPKSFAQHRYCRDHEYIHIKPYVCRYCGKDFAKAYNCRKHEMTHTGKKPYKCGICGQRFTDSSSRTRHERAHQGHRPFTCRYCKRGFARRDYCAKHEMSHRRRTISTPYSLDLEALEGEDPTYCP